MADCRHGATGADEANRVEGARKLGRDGHEPHPTGAEPPTELLEVDGTKLVGRDRASSLRVQERSFQVDSETAVVRRLDGLTGRQEVRRDAVLDEACLRVDVQVDEAGDDDEIGLRLLGRLDRSDALAADDHRSRPHAVQRINEDASEPHARQL
jgi:hypothetical protein